MYNTQISQFMEARPSRKQVWIGPETRKGQTDFLNVIKFVRECREGSRNLEDFLEALTLEDFPSLFQDLLSREMLAMYEGWPKSWPAYFKDGVSVDYRDVRRLALDGLESPLPELPANTELTRDELEEKNYQYAIKDRGRAVDIPVQVFVNNDLDSFRDIPTRLLKSGIRTEEKFAAELLCDSNGPNNSYFMASNNNLMTEALTAEGLQDAITMLISQTDEEGQPIYITGYTLVVSPQLKIQAQRILNGLEVRSSNAKGGGSAVMQLLSPVMPGEDSIQMVVNSYIPIISTTNGSTTWFLIANPSISRPSGELIFRPGLSAPRVSMKRSDVVPSAGSTEGAAEMQASFNRNTISMRVMHTFGGGFLDPKAAIGSDGTT